MKIIVAPDSFKECLPAREVASVMAETLRRALPGVDVVECPLSDGGEGLLDVLSPVFGGEIRYATVQDPLGKPVLARYLLSGSKALVEVAEACGLQRMAPAERNPLSAHTRGVGELLLEAHRQGARQFLVGLGGSATCDGGAGMLSVPRIRETLRDASFEVLYDVDIPCTGSSGAVRCYAPQKGAAPEDLEVLEERMLAQVKRLERESGISLADVPGAGAAGGLGAAFAAAFDATLSPGIGRVLTLSGFSGALDGASAVITGEGRSDLQTLSGKVPYGVLQSCAPSAIPVYLVSGRICNPRALLDAGFAQLAEVSPPDLSLHEALERDNAIRNLTLAITRLLPNL
mgnify:CR=1 FL=1